MEKKTEGAAPTRKPEPSTAAKTSGPAVSVQRLPAGKVSSAPLLFASSKYKGANCPLQASCSVPLPLCGMTQPSGHFFVLTHQPFGEHLFSWFKCTLYWSGSGAHHSTRVRARSPAGHLGLARPDAALARVELQAHLLTAGCGGGMRAPSGNHSVLGW